MARRPTVESAALAAAKALPYQGFGPCRTCGELRYCYGVNPESRVCPACLDEAHRGRPPNYRRRR